MVGIDYSEVSALALTEAVALARTHERSHIHVVHSVPGVVPIGHAMGTTDLTTAAVPTSTPVVIQPTVEMARDIQAFVEKTLTAGQGGELASGPNRATIAWTTHLRLTDPTHAIVQLASDIEADLIVLGTHGRSAIARFLLGSVAEGVVRHAPCPVLVVREHGATAAEGPRIEPPCAECLEARRGSEGRELWCERHREHHERAHTYHFTPFRGSHQSGLLLHPLK